jgi:hypothetical protein
MKTRIFQTTCNILVLLICFVGVTRASESGSAMTGQLFNGHMWQLLSESQKTTHLTGIQEGILLCLSQIKEDLLVPPETMKSLHQSGAFDRRRLLFSMQGISGISSRIDGFYRDTEHLSIPIIEAYRHVALVLNFAGATEIADDLARLKQKYKN